MTGLVKLSTKDLDVSNFILSKERLGSSTGGDLQFANINHSVLADSQTPASKISKSDPTRVVPQQFCLVVPDMHAKLTKAGVTMARKWDDDISEYRDQVWSASAKKHQMTLSLNPNVEEHASLIKAIKEINEHLAEQFAVRHNLSKVNVITPSPVRSATFQMQDGTDMECLFMQLNIVPTSTFRLGHEAQGTVSKMGISGPFFTNGHFVKLLALIPHTVMIRHKVAAEHEDIFVYTVSVLWNVMFADMLPPKVNENGETYEESSIRSTQERENSVQSAIGDLANFCENVDNAGGEDLVPPPPQKSRPKKRPSQSLEIPSESHESMLVESHAPKVKKARRKPAPVSPAPDGSPPSLAHLLG